ncbi:MAG: SGNH/GDSL hydrolase family protein, partial [Myxococcota bacterium]
LGLGVVAAAALPWTLLGWVNTHPVRSRALASWGLVALVVAGLEGGVRLTALNTTWTRTSGWKRASEEFKELLEIRRYRSYPRDGFPIQPPPADPAKKRVVALGGSSTGGAYQMDDLSLFWPKRLDELVAGEGWEVVNQGVGGWNTLHVRLYVESQIERLDADVLAVYVGHNDVLSPAPVPYRELYARYRTGDASVRAVSDALHGSRLYVGLKYALLALRDLGGAVAVPVADARENLAAVIDVAEAHGARVLLMTEGLNPDPLPMREYADMQRALAEERGQLYFDAAGALWRARDPDLFLDDCHLSAEGHRRLAGWIRDELFPKR